MAHWFDDLAKGLARGGMVRRRSFLQLAAAAGASLAGGLSFGARSSAQSSSPCTWRQSGNLITHEVSLSRDGLSLHRLLSFDVAQQIAALSVTVSRGGALLAKLDLTARKDSSVTGTASYGPDIRGVQTTTLRSSDGKAFQGEIDGRAFTAKERKPLFGDGTPVPRPDADADVRTSLNALIAAANASSKQCRPTAPASPAANRPAPHQALAHQGMPAPGVDWYEPGGEQYAACVGCEDGCGQSYFDATTDWTCFIDPVCMAYQLAKWGVCVGACHIPGGGCLPNPCGSFTTCAPGDTCYSYKDGKLCCPAPAALCNNVCCGKDVTTCLPDGSCGCSSKFDESPCGNQCCDNKTQICLNGLCCAKGETNQNGICCPKGQTNFKGKCCSPNLICGTVCCDDLSQCADPKTGLCCAFLSAPCGNKCCKAGSGEVCIDGNCCPAARSCGGICCPAGQTCTDPGKKQCSACPSGKVPCLPPTGAGSGMCCPPNVACCAGTCCKSGETCRFVGAGKYACGPPEVLK